MLKHWLFCLMLFTLPALADHPGQAAYDLGFDISRTALGRARNLPADDVKAMFEKAKADARGLRVTLPTPPTLNGQLSRDLSATIHYLLKEMDPVTSKLSKKQGPLFEIGILSNCLQLLYRPGDDMGLVRQLEDRTGAAGLSRDLVTPMRKALARKACDKDFQAALQLYQQTLRSKL